MGLKYEIIFAGRENTPRTHLEGSGIQWTVETPPLTLLCSALPRGLVSAEDRPRPLFTSVPVQRSLSYSEGQSHKLFHLTRLGIISYDIC